MHERTKMMIGDGGLRKLRAAKAAVFGLGGVGGICAEALARSGVGRLLLVDGDAVTDGNRNRQIIAARDTTGKRKADVMAARIAQITDDCIVEAVDVFYLPGTQCQVPLEDVDVIVDAMDTVTAKLTLIEAAQARGIPVITCLGMGNRLDPTQIIITGLADTEVCPLAKVMRRELRKHGIGHVPAVVSREVPVTVNTVSENGRHLCGSMMFVPSAAGLACASWAVRRLLENNAQ